MKHCYQAKYVSGQGFKLGYDLSKKIWYWKVDAEQMYV